MGAWVRWGALPPGLWCTIGVPSNLVIFVVVFHLADLCGESGGREGVCLRWGGGGVMKLGPKDSRAYVNGLPDKCEALTKFDGTPIVHQSRLLLQDEHTVCEGFTSVQLN